ncbi:MAG TPA: alpha/beta hydrolase [Chitinophagaceae bacterium]|nr:alpha/beta hydrolase [Chitinophagaceae bacterium]
MRNVILRLLFLVVLIPCSAICGFGQLPHLKFAIPYGTNEAVGKFAEVNGIKMYYEVYGQGKPLLLIHGNGGSINNMGYQIEYFSKNYRCIIADSRAHGKSGIGTGRLTYEQMADDWAALLDQLKIDSSYVVGWSDGGILGLLIAIRHPKKISKLAAMGANLRPDSTAIYSWAFPFIKRMNKYADSMLNLSDNGTQWQVMKKHLDLLANQPNISLRELHNISCPVLVLAGDKDVIREEHTTEIYQNISKSHLCIFPGETHMIPISDPVLFNATVDRFLKNPFKRPDTKDFFQ